MKSKTSWMKRNFVLLVAIGMLLLITSSFIQSYLNQIRHAKVHAEEHFTAECAMCGI